MVLSDRNIMIRVQAGETSLFAELIQRYQHRLQRFAASKLGDHLLAEDVVQDAFLAALHARQSYSPEFEFSTWIWTITLNLTRQHARKAKSDQERNLAYSARQSTEQPTALEPVEAALRDERTTQLSQWMTQLPDAQSDAIRLRFFGELPYDEIAQAMQCSVSGAKRRVKTGLIKLAEFAGRSGD